MIYQGGASSAKSLPASGWFSFSVPGAPSGVYVGLVGDDASIDPSEHTHSLRFTAGRLFVREDGVEWPGSYPHTPSTVYSIVRHAQEIFYCAGAAGAQSNDPRIPFTIPGAVFAVSSQPSSGPVFLDATLTADSDMVLGAALREEGDYNAASVRFLPLVMAASTSDVNSARVLFAPLQAEGAQGAGARVSMAPLEVYARAQNGYNTASVQMAPLQAEGAGDFSPPRGASLYFEYMPADASAPGTMLAEARPAFLPLVMKAGDYEYNDARVAFPSMLLGIGGRHTGGPRFSVSVPAFTGELPAPSALDVFGGEAVASDTVYPSSYMQVIEEAVADDAVLLSADTALLLDGGAAIAEGGATELHGTLLLEDEAVAEDGVEISGTLLLEAVAVAENDVLPSSETTRDLLDSVAVADDAALPYSYADALDSEAVADDAVVLVSLELLESEAVADDEALPSTRSMALLVSEAVADDEASLQVDTSAIVEEVAVADDAVFMKQAGLVAWVMNTSTGAVSWYDNWAFTSMATVGGKVFAAGPEGLFVLGGNADGADAIDARIDFGWQEFGGYDNAGQPKPEYFKKRVAALWFGYHADNVMTATVGTYGDAPSRNTYTMPARSAAQPRNNRITPGRGLNSRYWRISLNNNAGGHFELHSIAAEVAKSTRRL